MQLQRNGRARRRIQRRPHGVGVDVAFKIGVFRQGFEKVIVGGREFQEIDADRVIGSRRGDIAGPGRQSVIEEVGLQVYRSGRMERGVLGFIIASRPVSK